MYLGNEIKRKFSSLAKCISPPSYLLNQFSVNRSDNLDLVQFLFEYSYWFS